MARILSVAYDEPLLRTRHLLLEREGYEVVSSLGFADSLEQCKRDNFDLLTETTAGANHSSLICGRAIRLWRSSRIVKIHERSSTTSHSSVEAMTSLGGARNRVSTMPFAKASH
jgi:hypothetical protein